MTMTSRTRGWRPLAGWVALWLVGCGGGGDDGSAAAAGAGAVAATPAPTLAAAASLSTCGLPDFSTTALARINQYRAAGAQCGARGAFAATTALRWDDRLAQAADGHSRDMAANNYFAHDSLDGRTMAQRITAAGYTWAGLGENIAAGQATVNAVVDGWMASEGHCVNLMNPTFVHLGLACAAGTSATRYSSYWTLDLARPQ